MTMHAIPRARPDRAVRLDLTTGTAVHARVHAGSDPARPKCLLIHGNPGSVEDWAGVMPLVAGVVDVAAIDLPGFGASPRPSADRRRLRLDRLAADVVAVADALSWDAPVLVGHSHGGGVAQAVAARHPERVSALVLLGSLGAPRHRSYRLLALPGAAPAMRAVGAGLAVPALGSLWRGVFRRVMADIFHPEPVPADVVERELARCASRPEILASMVHAALGDPCAELLAAAPRLRCPVLFIHGQQDALVPLRCARNIHDRIREAGGRSRFEVLLGAGHMLPRYQAALVADRIASVVAAR